ncbi:peptidoglycan DD-metalloendopeptidase family protein [Streptomyces sp. NBC_00250]|uniref:peptidoglycan DD-metalloendopeptidase family protein n=1 Tax=Streptomyces sp. NBC_00250 TaxID=2903641 RepID=UPI002E282D83|nr:peptidoglycan DD-metalloendopeptidase family protein [Streptomyces sp. NBC_00250]
MATDLDIVGNAGVDVVPVAPTFHAKLERIVLPAADRVGQEAGRILGDRMADAIVRQVGTALPQAIQTGGQAAQRAASRQGSDTGGAFASSLRRKLELAFRAMPRLDVRLSDTGVDAQLARLRARMETLAGKRIGIDVDVTAAEAEVRRIDAELQRLGASHPNVAVRADTATARAALAELRAEIAAVDATEVDLDVDVDTTGARSALMSLGIQLAVLMAIPLGPVIAAGLGAVVSMAAAAGAGFGAFALAAVPAVKGVGEALKAQKAAQDDAANASLRGSAATARAASQAASQALQLAGAQASLATAHRNAERTIVQSNRAIEDAERALAQTGIRAADQRRQAADAIARAERSLLDAKRDVVRAEEGVTQAGVRAAEQRRQAAESVERAERSLADAARDVLQAEQELTQAREAATQQLKDLNERLADSTLDQRGAVLRVTEAQEELARVMKDPKATQLQRDRAQLAADEAERNLQRQREDITELKAEIVRQTKAGVDGSEQVTRAQDRLSDAQQKVKDEAKAVADAQRAAAQSQTKAAQELVDAQERVLDAQQKVRDEAAELTRAQKDAARAQTQAAQDLVDAQRRVADAVDNAANAQVSSAEAIASAERGVASARLAGASATSTAITKQQEYEQALAKLTPAQRDLYDSIAGPTGIKSAFDAWQKSLQPHVLPIFTRGVDGAKGSLPGLTPLVIGAANAIQTLMDKASAQLKTPFWQEFKKDLADNVEPAIVGFGVAFGNVIRGVAGIIDAFLPHMDGIAQRSDSITERFAKWGTSLKGSPDFERFLDYVKSSAPSVGALVGSVLTALLTTAQTLSPVSTALMTVVTPLFDAITWLATNVPELVIALWGIWAVNKAVVVGMAAFGAAMGLYNAVVLTAQVVTGGWAVALNATGIVPIIRAIVLVIGLLVAAVIYAYQNWDWFRETVDFVVDAVGTGFSWLWDKVLKPVLDGVWWLIQKVGDIAVWLWEKAIKPAFDFISTAAQYLFTAVVTLALLPAYLIFKALGEVAIWLWDHAIKPAFKAIGDAAVWLWNNAMKPVFTWIGDKATWLYDKAIKPAFKEAKKTFDALGDAGEWLWEKVLRPVFQWIGEKAGWLYDKAIKPAFENIGKAIDILSASFEDGKNAVEKAWNKIQEIAKKPVRFIIQHVYNEGIVPLWNRVAGITGAGKLKPLNMKGWARGGILPGQSTWRQGDDQLVPMRRGEGVYVSEAMRDPYERARLHAVNRAAMSGQSLGQFQGGYAEGGIVGWLKDKAGDVADIFSNPLDVFGKARDLVTDQLKPLLTNPWARSVAKMPGKVLNGLKDKALDFLGFGGGSGGGGGGTWLRPVDAAFGTPFGQRGSMWSSGRHTGLDFPAAVGTAIRAVAGGRVSMAQGGGPYGLHVMVNHGNGLSSLYAHMSSMLTQVGDTVQAGQTIGRVGATGNVTGPHLHLEARRNGATVDPMPFLTGGGGGGGSGVQRWRGVVQQALRMTGNPAGYADLTLRRMNQESGGNPEAVNNWDINARNGTPSVGLMQVIKPTFEAFAGHMRNVGPKLFGVSTNPLANVYSSMQYAMSRYGSLPTAYNRPGGYASGGFPDVGELAWVGENGPELVRFLHPTQVYSNSDSRAMARQAASLQAGGRGTPNIVVEARTFLGDRELTDIVRTEIDVRDADTARALTYGRMT